MPCGEHPLDVPPCGARVRPVFHHARSRIRDQFGHPGTKQARQHPDNRRKSHFPELRPEWPRRPRPPRPFCPAEGSPCGQENEDHERVCPCVDGLLAPLKGSSEGNQVVQALLITHPITPLPVSVDLGGLTPISHCALGRARGRRSWGCRASGLHPRRRAASPREAGA
jgi:hypothetical protein